MKKKTNTIWKALGLIYLLTIFYLFLSDAKSLPKDVNFSIFNIPSDKIVHFIIYLPFSILFYKSFEWYLKRFTIFKIIIFNILLGFILSITTETLQVLNPVRTVSIFDLFANFTGVLIGTLFLTLYIILFRQNK